MQQTALCSHYDLFIVIPGKAIYQIEFPSLDMVDHMNVTVKEAGMLSSPASSDGSWKLHPLPRPAARATARPRST